MTLQALNLGVAFNDKWIFRGASLEIDSGARLALVGPSGSGKSLLLKSLALLQSLTEGHVNWNGSRIKKAGVPDFRARVMYVPQRPADIDGSVEDFLAIPFDFKSHADKTFDRDRAENLLGQLGRDDEFLAKSQRELSGGEKQIASLVRALMLEPEMMLLDEPTSAMDGTTARKAEAVINQWCQSSTLHSTLWVTHDLQQADRVADSVLEMDTLLQ